jgi:HK97 family phage major capsid protein
MQAPSFKALTFLDMIPTGTTSSNLIEYVQLKAVPQGAKNVAELELKPQLGIEFEDASSAVRTIAAFMKMSRPSMQDVPGLASMINTLLPREIRRHLEDQCLNGDGVGQNLLGLNNVAGVQVVAGLASDNIADAILRAITALVLVDEAPNFVTLNPVTVQDLVLSKTSTGEYTFGYPGMYNQPSIWGLAVTQNRTIPQGEPLVGDNSAHQLLVREGLLVKTSDNDADDFTRNRVTVLSETRVAYIVWRPYAFCKVDLALVPGQSTLSNGGGAGTLSAGGGDDDEDKTVTTPQRSSRK